MTRLLSLLALLAAPAMAQDDTPRGDGRAGAEGARVIINEVNAADHPRVRIFATVLQNGALTTSLVVR